MASSHRHGDGHLKFISNSPHFFKIILQDTIQNGKLGIPGKFVKDYGNGMSSPACLRVPTGAVWKVELTKSDGKIWLKNGWQEFSNHYSLEFGHFLVFRYEGNSNFHVVIFDRSASEIEYPYTINNHRLSKEIPEQNTKESEDDESIHIIEKISPSGKMREKSELSCPRPPKKTRSTDSAIKIENNVMFETLASPCRHSGCPAREGDKSTSHHRIERLKAGKKAQALQRASSAFKSENPFFLVVMQPSYVSLGNKCTLALPTKFVRKHLMKKQCDVTLSNSNGKTWTVSYYREKKLYASLRTGWQTFVHDNNIQVGDVCAFELINCIEISFKVVIYQGQNANCHQSFALTDALHPVKKKARASYARQGCLEPLNAIKKAKTFQIARAFRSENPFFVIFLQPSYVQTNKVSIPEKFARKYFGKLREEVILHLSNGKSWPVKYYQRSLERPSAKLCSGWRTFVLDNNLQVGDVCVFELTEGTQISLKVTIYKMQVADDGNSGSPLADKSRENQVEPQESLVIKTETDWVTDEGDMSSLHNQHSTEEFPVPKIMENNIDASVLLQETQEEKSVSN
ncbi:hypothetical protein REPUB_Repub10bG0152400 [Reevesia pubescens]